MQCRYHVVAETKKARRKKAVNGFVMLSVVFNTMLYHSFIARRFAYSPCANPRDSQLFHAFSKLPWSENVELFLRLLVFPSTTRGGQ